MKRAFLFICLFCLACSTEAFAQRHSPQGVARGWHTDTSRKVLSQFRSGQITRLARQYGVRQTTVHVQFVVLRNGRVESAQVVRSSGNPAFDRKIEAIAQSMRLPPIPAPFNNERVKLGQSIRFH